MENNSKIFQKWPIIDSDGKNNLIDAYESQKWGGDFPDSLNKKFEKQFATYHDVKYCATISSGTAGLIAALQALGIEENDEVIVPAFTFVATATAVSSLNAIPVFVDIDEESHCISIKGISKAINERTKAIIAVHIGGNVCDIKEIKSVIGLSKIGIIEDCAQALGAELSGRKAGTSGDIGVFSFAQNKNLSSGEGGAIITNDEVLYRRVCEIRNHGRFSGMKNFHGSFGINYRLSEFQVAVLLAQLPKVDDLLKIKNEFAQKLSHKIKSLRLKWLTTMEINKSVNKHGYFSYVFLYHKEFINNVERYVILNEMAKCGLPVGNIQNYPIPICINPIFKDSQNVHYKKNIVNNINTTIKKCDEMIFIGQANGSAIMLGGDDNIQYVIDVIAYIDEKYNIK
ncbi:MAG: DegT/DnrJ/EryC1/StrS family aminotransferase [Defluviitaleaceae bacterium]|nr:DegT/DnrJ/EryC1/StrS family aminotransferase [Defluviitaleaceae bacterium]